MLLKLKPRLSHRVAHPTTHRTKASEIYWICQVLRSENMRDHDVEARPGKVSCVPGCFATFAISRRRVLSRARVSTPEAVLKAIVEGRGAETYERPCFLSSFCDSAAALTEK